MIEKLSPLLENLAENGWKYNWKCVLIYIVISIVLMIMWYGFLVVSGIADAFEEKFKPHNIISAIVVSIVYFVVMIMPLCVAEVVMRIIIK